MHFKFSQNLKRVCCLSLPVQHQRSPMLRSLSGLAAGTLRATATATRCHLRSTQQVTCLQAAVGGLPTQLQQLRERGAPARHCSIGYSANIGEFDDIEFVSRKLDAMELQDRAVKTRMRHQAYEKPHRRRYREFKSGWRKRKIRGVKQLVKLIEWRREEGHIGAKNTKNKSKVLWPLEGPASY
jgi:hypothetical protein